MSEHSHNVAT